MTGGLLPDDIETLARRVVEENAAVGRKVTVAESCTGGLVAAALTEIPGSSAVLDRGFVTYSNEAKMECLDVSLEIIETFGAVSIACAWAMAKGALDRSHADVAVAISGVAGPGGGTDNFARIVQSIITKHKLIEQPVVVLNKGGGSGAGGLVGSFRYECFHETISYSCLLR